MEGLCKRRRTNDDGGTGSLAGGKDRLSALPDCLLHEIMSLLKARQVVQTCVLSTRWRHLWRSVPCIDADETEFEGAAVAACYTEREVRWQKFEDFMDILLSRGNLSIAHLDKFRLHVSDQHCEGREYRWIRRGIKYDGDAAHAHGLGGGGIIQRQGLSSTRSWRLRKLHIDNVWLDALFSGHVRSGCQNLEDLELNSCRCEFHAIASGSLKNLVMKKCIMVGFSEITSPTLNSLVIDGGSNAKDCLLVITAPAAVSVLLAPGGLLGGFAVREMTPLAKASVRLRSCRIADHLKTLGGMSEVMTNLELSGAMAVVPGEWSATFPRFNSLRALELNGCDLSDGFQTLGLFLRNSPNLERLMLRHCKYSNDSKKKRGSSKSKNTEPAPCPNLVDARCENLKLTEIIYRDQDIRQLIELLLCISENLPNNCIKLIKN